MMSVKLFVDCLAETLPNHNMCLPLPQRSSRCAPALRPRCPQIAQAVSLTCICYRSTHDPPEIATASKRAQLTASRRRQRAALSAARAEVDRAANTAARHNRQHVLQVLLHQHQQKGSRHSRPRQQACCQQQKGSKGGYGLEGQAMWSTFCKS